MSHAKKIILAHRADNISTIYRIKIVSAIISN